jgi:mannose-6-phosphate isomerase-like protein (cupin superfamily)
VKEQHEKEKIMTNIRFEVIDHANQKTEEWRGGVMTRMLVSAVSSAFQLCQFEQWCEPGKGAPTHLHAVEEILTVRKGQADIWVNGKVFAVTAEQSIIIPAGCKHGFRNTGTEPLHTMATLAAPIFEASFDDVNEISRRYVPEFNAAS